MFEFLDGAAQATAGAMTAPFTGGFPWSKEQGDEVSVGGDKAAEGFGSEPSQRTLTDLVREWSDPNGFRESLQNGHEGDDVSILINTRDAQGNRKTSELTLAGDAAKNLPPYIGPMYGAPGMSTSWPENGQGMSTMNPDDGPKMDAGHAGIGIGKDFASMLTGKDEDEKPSAKTSEATDAFLADVDANVKSPTTGEPSFGFA